MLDVTSPSTTVKTITGRELTHIIRRASAVLRALIAADIAAGRIDHRRPTRRQSALLTGASYGFVSAIARLSERDRERLRNGLCTLAELRSDIPDRVVERFIARAGVDRVANAAARLARLAVAAE